MTISLCMIVKNEAETLFRCLSSVADAVDEIIIADTGSTDGTKDIALGFTDKVYDFIWIDDFSAARNFSFSKAKGDYIMWLDADDIISPQNADKLKDLKATLPENTDIVYMPYHIRFDEEGKPTYTYYRERLVKKSKNPVWVEPIHELIQISGKCEYIDIAVEHRKIRANPLGRNLKIFEKQLAQGKKLSPRLTYYYGRELMFNRKYVDAVIVFNNFLDGGDGWFENCLSACKDLSVCYEMLNDYDSAFAAAFRGFVYSVPRGDLLCRIGDLFAKKKDLENAKYWYLLALNCKKPTLSLGFLEEDYYGYIPAIELCVICFKQGETEEAVSYNELAGKIKPYSAAYAYNKRFFESINNKF